MAIGLIYAILGGAFLTLQGAANATIGTSIGTWQAAALTQGTGFIAALLLVWLAKDKSLGQLPQVNKTYWFGGAFAAFIIFGNIVSYHQVGAALAVSAQLIAQIVVTVALEKMGWFGKVKLRMGLPQWLGLGCMMIGILCLTIS